MSDDVEHLFMCLFASYFLYQKYIEIFCPLFRIFYIEMIVDLYSFFSKDFIYLFLDRGKGVRKGGTEASMCGCLLLTPLLGTWPATQACALTGNQTSNPLFPRPALNPLSHTGQG